MVLTRHKEEFTTGSYAVVFFFFKFTESTLLLPGNRVIELVKRVSKVHASVGLFRIRYQAFFIRSGFNRPLQGGSSVTVLCHFSVRSYRFLFVCCRLCLPAEKGLQRRLPACLLSAIFLIL